MSNDYSDYLKRQQRERLEKVTLSILNGLISRNPNVSQVGLVQQSIELAKEFIKQIDEDSRKK